MIFIVHSQHNRSNISANYGVPEYSYYFVLQRFIPLLEKQGRVIVVDEPEYEVDAIYAQAKAKDETCVYLSFTAPHNTVLNLNCPTFAVFAWEFDTLPNEVFDRDVRSDWLYVFKNIDGIITHSEFTVALLRKSLGDAYPILSAPAPIWDQYSILKEKLRPGISTAVDLELHCPRIDSRSIDLNAVKDCLYPHLNQPQAAASPADGGGFFSRLARVTRQHWKLLQQELSASSGADEDDQTEDNSAPIQTALEYREAVSLSISDRNPDVAPLVPVLEQFTNRSEGMLSLDGVVYTTVMNPSDGRKNWHDLVCAFCVAFKHNDDATLVFKLIQRDSENMLLDFIHRLYQLGPFACRVLVIDGFLDDANFQKLMSATSYGVNCAHGEGQCLPLMEALSAGIPAVAPCHTGMSDYINDEVAFLVDYSREAALFPHDPRAAYRTHRCRIDWHSLKDALIESYDVVKNQPQRYEKMSNAAQAQLQKHCSMTNVGIALTDFFQATDLQQTLKSKPWRATNKTPPKSPYQSQLQNAQRQGWFNTESGEIFTGIPLNEKDSILVVEPRLDAAHLYCASQNTHLFLWGTQQKHLTRQVDGLHQANAPYFRVFAVEEGRTQIPMESESVELVLLLDCLQLMSDPLAVLIEAVRVAKTDTRFLITTPRIEDEEARERYSEGHHWTIADLHHLLQESGLELVSQQVIGNYWQSLLMQHQIEMAGHSSDRQTKQAALESHLLLAKKISATSTFQSATDSLEN